MGESPRYLALEATKHNNNENCKKLGDEVGEHQAW